jgi:hypothetical protein
MIMLTLPEKLAGTPMSSLPSRQGQPNLLPCRRLYRRQGGWWFPGWWSDDLKVNSGRVETGRVRRSGRTER